MKTSVNTILNGTVSLVTLTNAGGASVFFSSQGARWTAARVPDSDGQLGNVLIGSRPDGDYTDDVYYMGATIGRFANRIGGASVDIDGKRYPLDCNDGENTNHGGFHGFDQALWDTAVIDGGVCFTRISPHMEGGFPGRLQVKVIYRWSDSNELTVEYYATTDRPTVVNLTCHAYFNLSAEAGTTIHQHQLMIPSTKILDTDAHFIPTGLIRTVKGTAFDFTSIRSLGTQMQADDPQLVQNRGYNHYYILPYHPGSMQLAALVRDPRSGRSLRVHTDYPGVLLYTAGYYAEPHTAICLETQLMPDAPHHPDFSSCLLRPGEVYRHSSIYAFQK
jgi:aldose 1-epimerase